MIATELPNTPASSVLVIRGSPPIMFTEPLSSTPSPNSSPRKLAAAAATAQSESGVTQILDRLLHHCRTVHLISPFFKFIEGLLVVPTPSKTSR